MKKKKQKENLEKMKIESININITGEEKKITEKTLKKVIPKSRSVNKSLKKLEDIKQTEVIQEKKPIKFDLDFIFRRERYILKNIFTNYLMSKIKRLISKKISVDLNLIHIYYLDKEVTDDKITIQDLIKDNRIRFLEVKKEIPVNENIISLNSNVYLIYKVRCKNIQNMKDFIEKIDIFFREKCMDKHYLCEPVGVNIYDVGFSCEDNCYQFKRYMSIVKRLDSNYSNTSYEYVPFDKNKLLRQKIANFQTLSNRSESMFINKGPYMTYEDLQKLNEKEEKKKWICKQGFVYKRK